MEYRYQQTRIDRIIFLGILLLLIFAPLAFGSVHVWAYSIVEFGVFLLLALRFADHLIVSRSKTLTWVKTPVNLILVMLLVLIGLQLLPLRESGLHYVPRATITHRSWYGPVMVGPLT